jgi:hypothetical protein
MSFRTVAREAVKLLWFGANLDHDPFNLIERNFVARPVIELRRSWRLVGRDGLSILDRASVFQISSYASGSE